MVSLPFSNESKQVSTPNQTSDSRAPMSSAPFKYKDDGSVDWGNMWETFCGLAQTGGPPHRGTLLTAPASPSPFTADYDWVVAETTRGIFEVSGLNAHAAEPGWIGVECASPGMALWLAQAIVCENVQARAGGKLLYLPVSEQFTLKGEIKNVITVVAKTTHYWHEHLPNELQQAAETEVQINLWLARVKRVLRILLPEPKSLRPS